MSDIFQNKQRFTTRRQFIQWSLLAGGVWAAFRLNGSIRAAESVKIPLATTEPNPDLSFDPMLVLRDFDYGTVKEEDGRTVREFEVYAHSTPLQLNSAITFISWNLNDRVPAPTLRATEGYAERNRPIAIYQNQLIRLYVLNTIEFDSALTFHIHANMFQIYRTGRTLEPNEESDVITMGTAERHILEFTYKYPGKYMFHPHQDYIAEHGCMGYFNVIPETA